MIMVEADKIIENSIRCTMLMKKEEFPDYLCPENWPGTERGRLPGDTDTEMKKGGIKRPK
jgi:hypothetical protein